VETLVHQAEEAEHAKYEDMQRELQTKSIRFAEQEEISDHASSHNHRTIKAADLTTKT
jgi:hypothetical protein